MTQAAKSPIAIQRPRCLGTTFSQLQCSYMGLDYRTVFRQICALNLDYIRLCSYWNEIEPIAGQFNFAILDWLLEESHRQGIDIILTVGMKAPRWAEFHFPDWVNDRYPQTSHQGAIDHNGTIADLTLNLIQAVVQHSREATNLQYWQVENEPLTRMEIAAGRYLSQEFLHREVSLVRALATPTQKILLTNAITLPAAQLPQDDRAFQVSLSLADAVGFNVYTKVPIGNSAFYVQPLPPFWKKLRQWQQTLTNHGKAAWIAEAQAEPWEPHQLVAMSRAEHPSASPQRLLQLVTTCVGLGYETILLWGCEYWYWQRQQGWQGWWQAVEQLIAAER